MNHGYISQVEGRVRNYATVMTQGEEEEVHKNAAYDEVIFSS